MEEAAAQAANGLSAEDTRLLEVLQVLWDGVYSIGYDEKHGWWASRIGVVGSMLTATDAEGLGKALVEDFGDGQ